MPILRLNNLHKTYPGPRGPLDILRGAELELGETEFVGVEGSSGAGKSTLLLVAGALLRPDGGEVRVAGEDPYALPANRRARFRSRHIGFVFQQFHLVPYLSVLENVLAPSLAHPAPDARERAHELIERFGLKARLHHVPAALSTGERQRAALARALLNRPKLILADEPTGNLDEENSTAVLAYLDEFARGGGAVLLVSHDPKALQSTQRTLRLAEGLLKPCAAVPASRP